MKTSIPLVALSLATACSAALASEFGRVISATAVTAPVAVPQQQCSDQPALVPPHTSGGGALLGALVGGVVGHNLGEGAGRAAATGLGAVAGSVIGDRAEAANTPPAAIALRSCQTSTSYENRIVGYDVIYEYNGQRYSTRMAQDPGAHIALEVTVVPAGSTAAVAPMPPLPTSPATVAPPVVYATPPAYGYYGPYGYLGGPAIAVEPHVVIGGYRHHGY